MLVDCTWQVFSGVWAGGQACQAAPGGLSWQQHGVSRVASQLSLGEPLSQPPMAPLWILRPSFVLACIAPQAAPGTPSRKRPGRAFTHH